MRRKDSLVSILLGQQRKRGGYGAEEMAPACTREMVVKLKPMVVACDPALRPKSDGNTERRPALTAFKGVRSPASVKDQHFLRVQRLPHTTHSIWSPHTIVIDRYHAQLRRIFGHYRVR